MKRAKQTSNGPCLSNGSEAIISTSKRPKKNISSIVTYKFSKEEVTTILRRTKQLKLLIKTILHIYITYFTFGGER